MGNVLSRDQLADAVARDRADGRARSRLPTAVSICSMSATCAICRRGRRSRPAGGRGERRRARRERSRAPAGRSTPAADRAELVAGLRGVDYVVLFSETDRRTTAEAGEAGRALQGHRLHGRYRARARRCLRVRRPHGDCRRRQGALHARTCRTADAWLTARR